MKVYCNKSVCTIILLIRDQLEPHFAHVYNFIGTSVYSCIDCLIKVLTVLGGSLAKFNTDKYIMSNQTALKFDT